MIVFDHIKKILIKIVFFLISNMISIVSRTKQSRQEQMRKIQRMTIPIKNRTYRIKNLRNAHC